jgi:hypothetical protein
MGPPLRVQRIDEASLEHGWTSIEEGSPETRSNTTRAGSTLCPVGMGGERQHCIKNRVPITRAWAACLSKTASE